MPSCDAIRSLRPSRDRDPPTYMAGCHITGAHISGYGPELWIHYWAEVQRLRPRRARAIEQGWMAAALVCGLRGVRGAVHCQASLSGGLSSASRDPEWTARPQSLPPAARRLPTLWRPHCCRSFHSNGASWQPDGASEACGGPLKVVYNYILLGAT